MIRRNKIIASVAVSVMAGVLVAGNLAPLQGYYAFAQETGVKTARYSAVKDINKTLEGYTPMDSSDPVEFGGTYIKYQGETIQLSETAIYLDAILYINLFRKVNEFYILYDELLSCHSIIDLDTKI